MDEGDIRLRNVTYSRFVELGRAPLPEEVAGFDRTAVLDGWRRLHDEHALVLDGDGQSLRMASPFSGVPTPYRVEAAGRWWYANCAWDAFGICAALHTDGAIQASCADCGAAIDVGVRQQRPTDESLVFHCVVPASAWWDDIVFT